jgi:hypothetical protein
MKDSKRQNRFNRHRILTTITALIIAAILYHWIRLWGIAALAVGLFLIWQYVKGPQKTKIAASLIFSAMLIFTAAAWNHYNLPPKVAIDNALANSIGTDNNVSSYNITGSIASSKSVKFTVNGTEIPLKAHDFSYKTSLKEGDNNFILVATNGSGEDREVLTLHRNTKAEDIAANSSSSDSATSAPTAPTNKQKVASWFTTYGYVLSLYSPDFDQINKDAGNSDTPAVGKDCQKLSDDVAKAQTVPAIPDAQSASDFSSALTYYQTGATQCVTAANNYDNQGLIDAAGVLVKGNDKIKTTTADIKAVQ